MVTPFTGFSYATGLASLGQGLGRVNQSIEEAENRKLLMSAFAGNPQLAALAATGNPALALQMQRTQGEQAASDRLNRSLGGLAPLGSGGGGGGVAPVSGAAGERQAGSGVANNALDMIMKHESGGKNVHQNVVPAGGGYNPSTGTVTGPSSASGYFQMINPTWRKAAAMAGIDISNYPTAMSAPYELQRKAASALYAKEGFSPWAPYNAAIRRDIARAGGPGAFVNDGPGGAVAAGPPTGPAPRGVAPAPRPSASAAPAADGFPSPAELAGMVRDGVLPEQLDEGFARQQWANDPGFRQQIQAWRQKQGGGAPVAQAPAPAPGQIRDTARTLDEPFVPGMLPAQPAGVAQAPQGAPPAAVPPQAAAEQPAPPDGRVRLAQAGTSDVPLQVSPGQFLAQRQQQKDGLSADPGVFRPPAATPDVEAYRQRAQEIRRQVAGAQGASAEARQSWMNEAARLDQLYSTMRQEQVTAARADHTEQTRLYREQQTELRRQQYELDKEQRAADRAKKEGPTELIREFVWARDNSMTTARTPAEYAQEKASATRKAEDKALPAELGARVALAQSFLDEADDLRKKVQEGGITGIVDAITGATGRGAQGEILRKIKSGSEAIVRNLTGAGMNESEARARVSQYEPAWNDDAATALSKFDMLRDQLLRIEAEAYRGRGVPESRRGRNPYFEGASPSSAAPAPAPAPAQVPRPAAAAPQRGLTREDLMAEARRRWGGQ